MTDPQAADAPKSPEEVEMGEPGVEEQDAPEGEEGEKKAPPITTFTDEEGTEWRPRLTTQVIRESSQQSGLTVSDIMGLRIPPHDIVNLIWYTCKAQAKGAKISYEKFMKRLDPLPVLLDAGVALVGSIDEAFPEMSTTMKKKVAEGVGVSIPFGPGGSETSSNSVLSRE